MFAVAGIISSCSGKSEKPEEEALAWDSIVVDTTTTLTTDSHSPKAEIHLNIKYALGKKSKSVNDSLLVSGLLSPDYLILNKDKKMEVPEAVRHFVARYLNDYKKDFGALYEKDKEHGSSYNLQYSCNTHVEEQPTGIVNYVAEVYNYSGGAHGMNISIAKNFDRETGKIQKLSDTFVPGYEEGLKELIVKELCNKFDVKDLQELQAKGIFVGMEPYVPENFINKEKEMEFIYCDTEIAEHAVGELRVTIPLKKLKDMLKSKE